jgi:prepilin peptidase CpaA
MPLLIHTTALVFAIVAGSIDWRYRRIPNILTIPMLALGIALNAFFAGWHGALFSLEGAGLALGTLFPAVLVRGLGAGDWKLLGAIGALVGPMTIIVILILALIIGGLMAVYAMIRERRVVSTFKNLSAIVKGLLIFGLRPHPEVSLDNPKLLKIPFGVATAIACVLVLSFGRQF